MPKFFVNVDGKLQEIGDGKSAYELAVYNGYNGTEQEWLASLKGADGKNFEYSDFTTEQLDSIKGDAGISPTITENADNTDKIYKLDIETVDGKFTTPNLKGADGQGGSGSTVDAPIKSISVNGTPISVDVNKNVDITIPTVTNDLTDDLKSSYDDAVTAKHTHENGTVLDGITAEKVESWDKAEENVQSDWNETDDTADGFIKNKPTIPTKVSQLENDSNYLSSIPEEYVTETELEAKGYLTEHQDISGKVDKVEGKSLISDTEIARLASVDNYDDTDIREELANKADITAIPTVDVTKSYVDTELAKKADTDHTHTTVNGHTVESDVPVDAKFTDTVYDDSSLSSKVTQNTNDISALKTADNVLSSRIDTLTSLSEGSTTGDAELQDIRVKADGTTATSAGNAIREQVSELKGDLGKLSEKIGNIIGINDNVNSGIKWKGKTLNFMGDSITEGYASTVKYTDIIASTLYATCNNYGIGGSTVANGQNPMYSRVLQMEEDADLCVVFGGTNDFANYDRILGEQFIVSNGKRTLNLDTNTFYGGLNQLCTNLYSRFPYSSLVLCTPINRRSFAGQETDMQANGNGLYLDEYVEAIKKVAAYFSIPCLDLYSTVNLHPYDAANIEKYYSASDQLHPNAEGHKHIANVMLSFFDTLADKRGRTVHTHSYTSEVTIAATCTRTGVRTFTCECGASYTESIPATGHSYVDGVCSVCGEVALLSISATYTGGKVTEGTALTDLKGLTVTAHYFDDSTKTVTGYTLNGEIAVGENTITVKYSGYTTTFVVVGVAIVNTYSVSDMSGVLEVKGGFYDLNGAWIHSPYDVNKYQSWKIPCNAGDKFTQYSISKHGMYKTYWDADGNFISSDTPANGSPTTFTVPDNAAIVYMWTAIEMVDINNCSYRLVRETVE